MKSLFTATFVSLAASTHLDNVNDVFTNFSFDQIRFKTQTNCQLDTYPEVIIRLSFLNPVYRFVNSWMAMLLSSLIPRSWYQKS